jgi:hypothetical protein
LAFQVFLEFNLLQENSHPSIEIGPIPLTYPTHKQIRRYKTFIGAGIAPAPLRDASADGS